MKCRVCGTICKEREEVQGCRASAIRSLLKTAPYDMKTGMVRLYECQDCGHIQTAFLLEPDFYEDYEDGNGALQYYGERKVLDRQLSKLKGYAGTAETLIEIGCGGGHALQVARKYFPRCTGVEPSEKEIRVAQNLLGGGQELISAYFDRALGLKDKYHAFCTFQVFEHMEQLKEALGYAYDILEEGGVGLVNVPNGRQILEEGLFHQINLEHINYFTPYSLTLLCKNAGFNILSLETDREAVELNIYVKKGSKCIPLDECRKKAREGLEQALSGCRTFAVYGAGAKTVVYSRLLVQDRMQYVFDSDPSKAGRYVAGLRLPVEQATKEKCSKCDAILIFASSYNHEIIALLKDFGYPGKIIYFEGYKVMVSDG